MTGENSINMALVAGLAAVVLAVVVGVVVTVVVLVARKSARKKWKDVKVNNPTPEGKIKWIREFHSCIYSNFNGRCPCRWLANPAINLHH
jgi:hypothetical protein